MVNTEPVLTVTDPRALEETMNYRGDWALFSLPVVETGS